MKTRSILIHPALRADEAIEITESVEEKKCLTFSVISDTGEVTLNYSEIQELLDAIHTLCPTKPSGKEVK